MKFVQKFCIFVSLCQIVPLSHQYLFERAKVIIRRTDSSKVQKKIYKPLTSIDHHHFADAVSIQVITKNMRMYDGAVKNLPYLQKLRLDECRIGNLAPGCLKNLPKLEVVYLNENHLKVIRSGVFNYLNIEELWLQKNEIETIDSNAFDNMPNLKVIRLNNNFLRIWDSRWFANTPKLTELFFRKNIIEALPARAFANIKTTHKINGTELVDTSIYLSKNRISFIHPDALRGIDSLYELHLQRNKLKEIDRRVFSHITELQKLNLAKNAISEIDKNTFENLNEMLELDLSHNLLICVPYKVVSLVKKIDVSGNLDMDCDCFYNLRDKLSEDGLSTEVIKNDSMCL